MYILTFWPNLKVKRILKYIKKKQDLVKIFIIEKKKLCTVFFVIQFTLTQLSLLLKLFWLKEIVGNGRLYSYKLAFAGLVNAGVYK